MSFDEKKRKFGDSYSSDSTLKKTGFSNLASYFTKTIAAVSSTVYNDGHFGFSEGGEDTGETLSILPGRPDLQSEILALSPWRNESLVHVCGPMSLVASCAKLSQECQIEFRSESFEL